MRWRGWAPTGRSPANEPGGGAVSRTERIAIGLSAVVVAVREGEARILTVAAAGAPAALPSGPFDPQAHRTFELALRAFVTAQTGYDLGYVEQLYTFGDEGRDAPLADLGEGASAADERVVSVGYLALTPAEGELPGAWTPWRNFFPWEDWRDGRPEAMAALEPQLRAWAGAARGDASERRLARLRALFGLDGRRWNEERVLDRYELLYEAGLAAEAARDRDRAAARAPAPLRASPALGAPMTSDHRRILATGLGRLRGKLKYRPVAFELLGEAFTLYDLQRAVEAVAGLPLHKPNFRRMVERTGLVEGLGRMDRGAGGRPAELFRFRRELAEAGPASGFSLPSLIRGDG